MRRDRLTIGLCASLLAWPAPGCRRDVDRSPVAAETPDAPPPAPATDIVLRVQARTRVGVGDDLEIALAVRNESDAPVTLVRPVYGSWELARHPRYELEWRDASTDELIPDPLGFAPGLECGTLDPITTADRVRVEPGATAPLNNAPAARTRHEVLPSARPGSYALRIRYLAQGIEGATPLQVWSEPITIEIAGGDPAMWSCRAKQLAARTDHEWIDVNPGALVPVGDGFALVFRDYRNRVVGAEQRPAGDIWIRPVRSDLSPTAEPTLVRALDEEAGWLGVAAIGHSVLVVSTPGPVGSRRVEAQLVDLAGREPAIAEVVRLQDAPGNPYVTRVVAIGDRFAVAHDGDARHDGELILRFVDRSGAAIAKRKTVASEVIDFDLLAHGGELIAITLERGEHQGGVIRRLHGQTGEPLTDPVEFALDPSVPISGARVDGSALELAWADASIRGDDPSDTMGLFAGRFALVDGHPLGPARALSPTSRDVARFGDVAWRGSQLAFAYLDGDTLTLGPASGPTTQLSPAVGGTVDVEPTATGFVLVWNDQRDDDSPACRKLDRCVSEAYAARLHPDASLAAGPVRLTAKARPYPFVPSDWEWQKYCP